MKISRLLFLIILSAVLIGCTESECSETVKASLAPHYLNTSTSTLSFPCYKSESDDFYIYSQRTPWKLNTTANWIKTSPSSDNGSSDSTKLHISVDENLSGDTARVNIVFVESTVSEWAFSKPVSVCQSAATPYITPEQAQITIPGRSTQKIVPVSSNTNWVPTSDKSFLKVIREGDNLILQAESNEDTNNGRIANVTLTGAITSTIIVEQEPSDILVSSDTLLFDNIASSYTLRLDSDIPWTASTAFSWIQISPQSGKVGVSNLTISVTPNTSTTTREGSIYLRINNKSIKIPILQRGYYVDTDNHRVEFGSHKESMSLTLSTNDTWNARVKHNEWLTVTPQSGNRDAAIVLDASENATTTPRKDTLYINTNNSGSIIVEILQNARYLSSSAQSISFFGKGGSSTPIQIFSDAKYTISHLGDWFKMTETNGTIQVSTDRNNSETWREGSITITATDLTEGKLIISIPVTQAIDGITFSKESYTTDIDYNLLNSEDLSITITQYSSDKNYNETGTNTNIIKEFYNDRGDINNGNSDGIQKEEYNENNNNGNNIEKNNYDNEKDYDE